MLSEKLTKFKHHIYILNQYFIYFLRKKRKLVNLEETELKVHKISQN